MTTGAAAAQPDDPGATTVATTSAASGRRRPQQLLFSLLGTTVLDRETNPIPSRVFIEFFGELGIGDAATRATLGRLTRRDLLTRHRQGRTAGFTLSPHGSDLLREAGERVMSPQPFDHPDGEWTLLSFSLPESRRDLRHQLRARLVWAGFGPLRDGLWIAPGAVDTTKVLAGVPLAPEERETLDAFVARPLPPTQVEAFIHRAWNIAELRAAHDYFLAQWEQHVPAAGNPLAELTLLVADWLRLLRTDPGLPVVHLPPDWPAGRSTATYRRLSSSLEDPALAKFAEMLSVKASRRRR